MKYKTTAVTPTSAGEGRYTFTVSDGQYDLEGDRILVAGWDLQGFRANPVILGNHDHRQFPIARASAIWATPDALKATIEFPPEGISARSDEARGLVQAGFLRTTSVGFDPGEHQPNARGGVDFTRGHRLLEVSLVGVPANPRALLDEVKLRTWLGGGTSARPPRGFASMADFFAQTVACDRHGRARGGTDEELVTVDREEVRAAIRDVIHETTEAAVATRMRALQGRLD